MPRWLKWGSAQKKRSATATTELGHKLTGSANHRTELGAVLGEEMCRTLVELTATGLTTLDRLSRPAKSPESRTDGPVIIVIEGALLDTMDDLIQCRLFA
jgi:hypothetical protein